jgi:hypothetical protein
MTGFMGRHFQIPTTKIKSNEMQFTRSPALLDFINAIINIHSALFDLVFSNISLLFYFKLSCGYHPPLLLDFSLTLDFHLISLTPHRSYAPGEYLLLYNVLEARGSVAG